MSTGGNLRVTLETAAERRRLERAQAEQSDATGGLKRVERPPEDPDHLSRAAIISSVQLELVI